MTISPAQPNLCDSEHPGMKVLVEPHLTFVRVGFGYSLMVYIGKGFETDGASVPEGLLDDPDYGEEAKAYLFDMYPGITTRWDMEKLYSNIVGTPWDMPRLLAAIVHDALYSCKWKWRWFCDLIYRRILVANNYDFMRAEIEYSAIRAVGWRNWNAVTDLERDRARRIVQIEFVRNKKISKITKMLQG